MSASIRMALNPLPWNHKRSRKPDGFRMRSIQSFWYKGYPVRTPLRTKLRNKRVFSVPWKWLGIAVYCVPNFLFSAEKHITQIHPEATEWVRGIHLHLFSLAAYLHSTAVGEKRLRAVSLLPGLRGRHPCHSHISNTALLFTPKQTTWAH